MPLQITINVTPTLPQQQQRIQALGKKFVDFTAVMKQIGSELKSYYSGQAFASQGGVFGHKWTPLSMKYARAKANKFPGRGMLERTGAMKNSFRAVSTSNSVVISNTSPYFVYHQSTDARTKMPWRPSLGINDDVRSIAQQLIEADIQKKLAGN